MKYYNNCQQYVEPQRVMNWTAFWLLCLCCFPGFCVYLIIYAVSAKRCPMCNSINWGVKPSETRVIHVEKESPVIQDQPIYCTTCGTQLARGTKYCPECGNKIL